MLPSSTDIAEHNAWHTFSRDPTQATYDAWYTTAMAHLLAGRWDRNALNRWDREAQRMLCTPALTPMKD